MSDITKILSSIQAGNAQASAELLPIVYEELRKLAKARLARERVDHTLQSTALVHEAFIRLVDVDDAQRWENRAHFFAAAAQAMRRILVESARRKQSQKAGGQHQRVDLDPDAITIDNTRDHEVLDVDIALERLMLENPEAAKLVELKYFGGLTLDEAATSMGVSSRTAARYWSYAKAWLHHAISNSQSEAAN